jgi:hypothetical protein
MYAYFPFTWPACVTFCDAFPFAIPKSITFTVPS